MTSSEFTVSILWVMAGIAFWTLALVLLVTRHFAPSFAFSCLTILAARQLSVLKKGYTK